MQRIIFTRLATSSRFAAQRALSTSTRRATQSSSARWIVPSSIIATGLATYFLTQPLALDAKKTSTTQKESNDANSEVTTATETKTESKSDTETKPEGETEGEAVPEQSAAYNPETGEINWDCPCLGGMANGPCGEEFKEAFACFVYSEAEPKGFDCIEKFQNMQNCFRKYPEVYSEEIRGEDEPVDDLKLDDLPDNVEVVVVDEKVTIVEDVKTDAPGAAVDEVAKEDVVPVTESKPDTTA